MNHDAFINLTEIVDQMTDYYKSKNAKYAIPIEKPVKCDGGKTLIERLIHLFQVRNRLELGDILGVTPGTLSTWTTRETTPFELLVRIHLATGVPMEYLCYGTGRSYSTEIDENEESFTVQEPAEAYRLPVLKVFVIENGKLIQRDQLRTDSAAYPAFGIEPTGNDFALLHNGRLYFVSSRETAITKGRYLFSVNDVYQVGELRQLPDGSTYYFDGDDRFPVNMEATTVHGKVVSVLESV
ncbi:helix-turn-helix domain-containing protein [Shewanella algae]|uniref:helix-turn-helix domain-containing protein n=1 Tax=Shewanella algae TaxID=38313 RepID=UPI0037C8998B